MTELTHHSTFKREGRPGFDVRIAEGAGVKEIYINVRPTPLASGEAGVRDVYGRLWQLLRENSAGIFSERIFTQPGVVRSVLHGRRAGLGELGDDVPPTVLEAPPSGAGPEAPQLQIHAVGGNAKPEPITYDGRPIGRRIFGQGRDWVHINIRSSTPSAAPAEQAREVYERANQVLSEQGMSFRCVGRTWVWLRDILDWYGEFNRARTAVFEETGLVAAGNRATFLPASTGIGVSPAGGGACGLELIAMSDGRESIRSSEAAGEQCSAFSYGSAFARAVVAPMPSGEALMVSGTAAIDSSGVSEHPGDIRGQIDATIQHLRSLMAEAGWSDEHVVSAIGYCKTPEVAAVFSEEWPSLSWPRVEIIGDVCREELLFEMEVMAARGCAGR